VGKLVMQQFVSADGFAANEEECERSYREGEQPLLAAPANSPSATCNRSGSAAASVPAATDATSSTTTFSTAIPPARLDFDRRTRRRWRARERPRGVGRAHLSSRRRFREVPNGYIRITTAVYGRTRGGSTKDPTCRAIVPGLARPCTRCRPRERSRKAGVMGSNPIVGLETQLGKLVPDWSRPEHLPNVSARR